MTNLIVQVFENNVEQALRAMKKKSAAIGLVKEMKSRAFHEKPGDRKRRKEREARKKLRKADKRRAEWDRDPASSG